MFEVVKIYERIYDNHNKEPEGFLGEFEKIQQIQEDAWVDDFIGRRISDNEICFISSREIVGINGGIAYYVHPLSFLTLKEIKNDYNNSATTFLQEKRERPKSTRVRIFHDLSFVNLQNEMNRWIIDNSNIDGFKIDNINYPTKDTAMIVYECYGNKSCI